MKLLARLPSKWLSLILLLFAVTLTARPATFIFNQNNKLEHAHRSSVISDGRMNAPSAQGYPSALDFNTLHRRIPPGLPPLYPTRLQMYQTHFATITTMMPISAAAGFLESFFRSIVEKANPKGGQWSLLPQQQAFKIEEGNFRLAFSCIGDTIPWHFVHKFAQMLLNATLRGVTELFETIYSHEAQQIWVKVTFELIEDSSSGSNSGEGQGYREGSIPSFTSL